MADLPNRVYELRRQRGWSQQHLADLVGCSKMHVSGIERGTRDFSLSLMRRMADAFDVPVADLLARKDNPQLLDDAERRLLETYRQAEPDKQDDIRRVADALVPFKGPEPQGDRLLPSSRLKKSAA